jgi:biopolymer transport protein ExbD
MAQVGGDSDGPNVELNLVPFIDLMCVCITFLLVTAVFTQVSMIQIGTSVYGKRSEQEVVIPDLAHIAFRLDVTARGYVINIEKQKVNIPMLGDEYDGIRLLAELQDIKSRFPEKVDAVISISDEISYENMIRGMDALLQAGFSDIGVATGGPG